LIDWRARFESFAARKTTEARHARIDRFVTDGASSPTYLKEYVAVGNAWTRAMFDGDFYVSAPASQHLPATSLVFVQSHDGNTGARNPSTLGGGEADKHLIYEGLSRVAADAVLGGAATIRGGDILLSTWHPEIVSLRAELRLPRHPVQVVATLRGMALEDGLIFNVPEVRVVLLTVPECVAVLERALAARPWITPVMMPAKGSLREAFVQLRRLGLRTISCIGGRTLARQLLDHALVDDVYLTTAAKPGGDPNTPIHDRAWRGDVITRKHGTGRETGVIFEHIQPRR
jgi:riboflavin biosynthesis pyrimidine reductase